MRAGALARSIALGVCGLVGLAGITGDSGAAEKPGAPQTLRAGGENHHLLMGTAADAELLSAEPIYASTLSTEYSQLEPETEMKFGPIHPEPGKYNYGDADKLVAFAEAHAMKVRGHNLVWHQQLPDWITDPATPWTPATLSHTLQDHIANVVGHYRGKVYAWDVVNEPFNDNGTMRSTVWYDKPGIGYAGQGTKSIEQALLWAHAADPGAKLFVNDYGADALGAKSDALYRMARDFRKRGVPLTGIGLEMHIDTGFDSDYKLNLFSANLRRFAALGLEVQITELDVELPNTGSDSLADQARTYRDVLDVCLKQRGCTAFQTWGFTDRHSWIPATYKGYGRALPFDENYRKKPAYTEMLKRLK